MTSSIVTRNQYTLDLGLYSENTLPESQMKRYFFTSLIAFGIPTLIFWFTLPIRSIQSTLWLVAFVLFVVGDGVTTSLAKRYDNLEEGGPATRFLCGRNPSTVCAFGTRIVFFSLSLIAYLIVIAAGIGARFELITLTALMLPLVLTVVSAIVLANNSYYILRRAWTSSPTA